MLSLSASANFYALICLILSVFVTLTIFSEFYRGARVIASRDGANMLSAVGELTMRNTRRYGGYVVHFGMVLIFIGIAGSAFNKDIQKEMAAGETPHDRAVHDSLPEFRLRRRTTITQSERATLEVFRNGKSEMMLYPRARLLPGEPGDRNDGGQSKHAAARSLRRLRGPQPGHRSACDSRLPESAREMDLVWRHGGGAGHRAWRCCRIARAALVLRPATERHGATLALRDAVATLSRHRDRAIGWSHD